MSRPLTPADWAQLEPLVDAILDAPPEERAVLLEHLSGGDASRRLELERLVADCERGFPLLDRSAAERFTQLFDEDVQLPRSLADRYPVSRELGRGGMAVVYLARDVKHGRDVAVKIIRPELAAALGRERFLREIAIAAQLHHPHIVPLYDSGEADGLLYYVMPYESEHSLRMPSQVGRRLPAHCTGVGKALLAYLSPTALAEVIERQQLCRRQAVRTAIFGTIMKHRAIAAHGSRHERALPCRRGLHGFRARLASEPDTRPQ